MESKNYKEAIEIVKAVDLLADFFGETFEKVGGRLVFLDEVRREKLNNAILLRNEWSDMSFEERAHAFGYEPVKTKRGYSITKELSAPSTTKGETNNLTD